ncbi:MAG: asparagine synthase (glutamine-hydrolyzing) [Bacteroidota bacterium]
MCGIVGFSDFNKRSSEEMLAKMTEVLHHRGPDDSGSYFTDVPLAQLGFGHRRLSIIDLSRLGHQPMVSEDGNHRIVYNGEVYNFKEIRVELEKRGHRFRSNSDTEVILKSYIEWGTAGFDRFIGMFALCIYDQSKEKLILLRDRAGVKPLYYSWEDGLFLFSSELKCFHQHNGWKKEIDTNGVSLFLKHGWIPAPHTIFKKTYKLKPGHFLELNLRTKDLKEHKYWDVFDYYNKPRLDLSLDEALSHTHELLKSASEYRMVSDTPVGVFLSGGYDSSTVAALLQSDRTERLKTFAIGFDEKEFDEAPYAKQVANHLGTDHTELYCSQEEALQLFDRLPLYYDEPFGDSSAIPTMLVSQLASQHVKVALSADGGDEVFAGYTRYFSDASVFEKIHKIPKPIRQLYGHTLSGKLAPLLASNTYKEILYQKFDAVIGLENVKTSYRYRVEPIHFSDRELNRLILGQKGKAYGHTFYDDMHLLSTDLDKIRFMTALEYKTTMVDDILVKVDRATMSYSLESREPLLDHRLIEFSSRLPRHILCHRDIPKYLIREICHRYIPREIMERPKRGFAIPTRQWLNDRLKKHVDHYFSDSFIRQQGIFHVDETNKMLRDFYDGTDNNPERLWIFLMFQIWFDKWS